MSICGYFENQATYWLLPLLSQQSSVFAAAFWPQLQEQVADLRNSEPEDAALSSAITHNHILALTTAFCDLFSIPVKILKYVKS